jgi:hypothetical protein
VSDAGVRARLRAVRQQAAAQAIASESAFHQARVLLLVDAFTGRSRGLYGLARLARLDFLLRFPPVLDYMTIEGVEGWPDAGQSLPAERLATDLALASARYGLWTDRYTLVVGALLGRQLVRPTPGRILELLTTRAGRSVAADLVSTDDWRRTHVRAQFLHQRLNASAQRLDLLLRQALTRMTSATTTAISS